MTDELHEALDRLAIRCGFPKVENSVQLLDTVGNLVERLKHENGIAPELIADALFTNGDGAVADRLVLTGPDGKDLGGWCRAAAVGWIRKTMRRAGHE